jgi:anti-sigma factor RsiW
MQCPEFEIRLCDYLDGTLDRVPRQEVEEHASGCAACAALLADAQAVTAFFERTPDVEAPPDLAAQILYRTQAARSAAARAGGGWRRWLQPLLAPRFVMGMAMTILSLSMFARVANVEIRQLRPADLSPTAVWTSVSGRVQHLWNQGAAVYENIRLFYQVATELREAEADAEEAAPEGSGKAGASADPRRIEPEPKR